LKVHPSIPQLAVLSVVVLLQPNLPRHPRIHPRSVGSIFPNFRRILIAFYVIRNAIAPFLPVGVAVSTRTRLISLTSTTSSMAGHPLVLIPTERHSLGIILRIGLLHLLGAHDPITVYVIAVRPSGLATGTHDALVPVMITALLLVTVTMMVITLVTLEEATLPVLLEEIHPDLPSAEGLRLDVLGQRVHFIYVEVDRFIN
jgi:hypothetical protein